MQTILFEEANGVAILTLNRPSVKNAMDEEMRRQLAELIIDIQNDNSIRVLIITGAGGTFCSGGDIRGMQEGSPEATRTRLISIHNWCEPLMNLDKPVIAAVDGVAYGAGLGLVLTADMVLSTPRARFCASFLRMGLIPDFALLYTLPRIVGRQRAKDLVFSAREFDAEEARNMGIVLEIQSVDMLMARAKQMAASMAKASPIALSIAKRALNVSTDSNLTAMLEIEASGQSVARSTDYHSNAVSRFIKKEPPLFHWPD